MAAAAVVATVAAFVRQHWPWLHLPRVICLCRPLPFGCCFFIKIINAAFGACKNAVY